MSTRIYKDFDLPTKHLMNDSHFVPQKARNEEEIERRKRQPAGTIILESQHLGIKMAKLIIKQVKSPEDINFSSELIAASGLNSAWYLFGRNAPVQRRRLKLELLATDDPEQRPSTYMLMQNSRDDLLLAEQQSQELLNVYRAAWTQTERQKISLGKTVGHAALTLSCVALGDKIGYEDTYLTNFEVQDLARKRGLFALEKARSISEKIGTPPSLAQFADKDSDLSVFWRRNAPNGALEAYENAAQNIIQP